MSALHPRVPLFLSPILSLPLCCLTIRVLLVRRIACSWRMRCIDPVHARVCSRAVGTAGAMERRVASWLLDVAWRLLRTQRQSARELHPLVLPCCLLPAPFAVDALLSCARQRSAAAVCGCRVTPAHGHGSSTLMRPYHQRCDCPMIWTAVERRNGQRMQMSQPNVPWSLRPPTSEQHCDTTPVRAERSRGDHRQEQSPVIEAKTGQLAA